MKIIKNIRLYDKPETLTSITIKDNIILNIGDEINNENAEIIDAENGIAMPYGIDTFCFVGEPGFEYRETFERAANKALNGGFNTLLCLPNTQPTFDSASLAHYFSEKNKNSQVAFIPMGAATQQCLGKDMAEIYDMYAQGINIFGDGSKTIDDEALILRILQYLKPINATFVNIPLSKKLSNNSYVHESENSVKLGLKGCPHIAETLAIQRDIALVKYTNSKIHWANITSGESVKLIKQAKADGLKVSCSINAMNLYYNESVYQTFDSKYKVYPIIRSENDRQALISGVIDGTIDMINSNHHPWDLEHKEVEIEYAENGANTLQHTILSAWEILKDKISYMQFNKLININPSTLINIKANTIEPKCGVNFFIMRAKESNNDRIYDKGASVLSGEKYSHFIHRVC